MFVCAKLHSRYQLRPDMKFVYASNFWDILHKLRCTLHKGQRIHHTDSHQSLRQNGLGRMGKFTIVQLNPVAVMYTSSSLKERQQSSQYRRQWESLFTQTTKGHPTDLSSTLPLFQQCYSVLNTRNTQEQPRIYFYYLYFHIVSFVTVSMRGE